MDWAHFLLGVARHNLVGLEGLETRGSGIVTRLQTLAGVRGKGGVASANFHYLVILTVIQQVHNRLLICVVFLFSDYLMPYDTWWGEDNTGISTFRLRFFSLFSSIVNPLCYPSFLDRMPCIVNITTRKCKFRFDGTNYTSAANFHARLCFRGDGLPRQSSAFIQHSSSGSPEHLLIRELDL